MEEQRHFGVWDYVVFSLMLAVSVAIGIFHGCRGRKQKTTTGFLMANRNLSIVPVAISILVSFLSAITILGNPAEMYTNGTQYSMSTFGMICAIIITALVFVPLLYPLKLTSSFEVLYMGIASFAPSTALEAVTGFPAWVAIIIVWVVSTFYTTLGGIKAVVWVDVFQAAVMLVGVLAVVIEGVIQVGGMATVWQINYDWERISFFDFNPDPTQRHSFWSLVVGGTVTWTAIYGCNPASVHKFCSLPSLEKARISVLLTCLGVTLLLFITCLSGVVIFAYYVQQGCDPLTAGIIENSNQIIPYFVIDVLNLPGLAGLFVSCLFSGSLSCVSASLNALGVVTWESFLKPFLGHRLTEVQKTWVTKVLMLMFAGVGIGVAFMAKGLGGTVLQASLSFTGAASGPVLGLFLLGGLFPWANGHGAIVGGILGLIFPLWISIGAYSLPAAPYTLPFPTNSCVVSNLSMTTMAMATTSWITPDALSTTVAYPQKVSGLDVLYTVSYLWIPSIGAATVVVVGLIVSFATGPMNTDEVDPKYLIPLFDRLFCCLPASWRRTLRCKKEFQKPEDIRASDGIDVFDAEFVVPTTEENPSKQPFTVMAADVLTNENRSVTSNDMFRKKDVANDAVGTENLSSGTYQCTTHL